MRLNKFIAQSGYCSRRKADDLIEGGKVLVNDKPPVLGQKIDPEVDSVRIKGGPTFGKPSRRKTVLLLLNKPKGYVCTKNRDQATRTVYDLLPDNLQSLNSIGRLDKDSEGLLLFTNDGDLANKLAHPNYGKKKTYIVTVRGQVIEKELEQIRGGMRLLEYSTAPAQASFISYNKKDGRTTLEITLTEGKKRQIRNMFLCLKKPVKKLVRTKFGKWNLGSMKPGEWRIVGK
ncbi:MAG: pseudouridine synthase [Candidatus Gracilibacteria bacterium]|nr:pseudouridine synthase [Candidatus Gracilibacteria bacterium]